MQFFRSSSSTWWLQRSLRIDA